MSAMLGNCDANYRGERAMILLYLLACIKHVETEIAHPCSIKEGENIMGGIVDQVDNNVVAVSFENHKLLYFNCNDILQYVGRGSDYEKF